MKKRRKKESVFTEVIHTRVAKSTYLKLLEKARRYNTSAASLVRQAIEYYVNDSKNVLLPRN